MKKVFCSLVIALFYSQVAVAYPVRTVTLECSGKDVDGTAALTIVKTYNDVTGKLSFDVKMSVEGTFDGTPGVLAGQATIEGDITKVRPNSPVYDVSDKSGKNKISIQSVGRSLKTPDNVPGDIVRAQVETGHPISPYLMMKGVVGNFPYDRSLKVSRTMNVAIISGNGIGTTTLANGDMTCTRVIHD